MSNGLTHVNRVYRAPNPNHAFMDHERPLTLLFDLCVIGFYKWARKRLQLLGINSYKTHYRFDEHICIEAHRMGAIVVTADKEFPCEPKIVLPYPPYKRPKYEKWMVFLLKKLDDYFFLHRCDGNNGS